jgi:hypothetical protein
MATVSLGQKIGVKSNQEQWKWQPHDKTASDMCVALRERRRGTICPECGGQQAVSEQHVTCIFRLEVCKARN